MVHSSPAWTIYHLVRCCLKKKELRRQLSAKALGSILGITKKKKEKRKTQRSKASASGRGLNPPIGLKLSQAIFALQHS